MTNPEVRKFLWTGISLIGLLMCGILHQILDEDGPAHVTSVLFDALPTGSYVFIHHMLATGDPASAELQDAIAKGLGHVQFRTMDQIRELFRDLEMVDPGLVLVPEWRPGPATPCIRDHPVLGLACAGVARKT